MNMRCWLAGLALIGPCAAAAPEPKTNAVRVQQTDDFVQIDTDLLQARVRKKGYVSGIAAGSLLDRKTGARDLGFGLHIMDFLLAPGWKEDGYGRDAKVHGNLPKHYIEGPQICTKARKLDPEVMAVTLGEVKGVALRVRYQFTEAAAGLKAGSVWQQTLVFLPGVRYVLAGEQITSANDVDTLFYRLDMPGHIKHTKGDTFAQVYLSYHGKVPAAAFGENFAPDAKYLYQRKEGKVPERMIRAYQVKVDGKPGPWLAGMTLDPAQVHEAWCHQRGYVCFIEELHGRKVKAGETIGAAYAIGWFDDIPEMEKVFDRYKGKKSLTVKDGKVLLQ